MENNNEQNLSNVQNLSIERILGKTLVERIEHDILKHEIREPKHIQAILDFFTEAILYSSLLDMVLDHELEIFKVQEDPETGKLEPVFIGKEFSETPKYNSTEETE